MSVCRSVGKGIGTLAAITAKTSRLNSHLVTNYSFRHNINYKSGRTIYVTNVKLMGLVLKEM